MLSLDLCCAEYTINSDADFDPSSDLSLMPRSLIHGSPRRFYYGLNLTDDPGNANFCSPIQMHYMHMIKYYYVTMITDAIRKATDQYGLPGMMPDCIRG